MRDSVILSNQAPLETPFQQNTGWVPGPKQNTCQADLSQGNVRRADVISHCLLNNLFPLPRGLASSLPFLPPPLTQLQKALHFWKTICFQSSEGTERRRAAWGNAFCISLPSIPTVSVFCLRALQGGNTFTHTCNHHFLAEEQLEHQLTLCSIAVWQESWAKQALLKFGPRAFLMLTYRSIITILLKNTHSKMSLGQNSVTMVGGWMYLWVKYHMIEKIQNSNTQTLSLT